MFSLLFPKKNAVHTDLLRGTADVHSHLLPGVDDGVQTMDEALDILSLYEKLGVKTVWLTPHIMEDIPNTTACLKECFEELRATYIGSVRLHLAAEYMLDKIFEERMEIQDLLPLSEKADHLLVETSCFRPPMNFTELLERIKSQGYHPVLAHPERYIYMSDKDCMKLKGIGVLFQANLSSLTGFYGKKVQKKAEWMFKNGYYDLVGTDTHSLELVQKIIYDRGMGGKKIFHLLRSSIRNC